MAGKDYSWVCVIQTAGLQGCHPSREGKAFPSLVGDLFPGVILKEEPGQPQDLLPTPARRSGRIDLWGGHLLGLKPAASDVPRARVKTLLRLSSGLSKLRKSVQSEITSGSKLHPPFPLELFYIINLYGHCTPLSVLAISCRCPFLVLCSGSLTGRTELLKHGFSHFKVHKINLSLVRLCP